MVEVSKCKAVDERPKRIDEYTAKNYFAKFSGYEGEQLSAADALGKVADNCKFNKLPTAVRISYEVRDYVSTLEHVIENLCAELRDLREENIQLTKR